MAEQFKPLRENWLERFKRRRQSERFLVVPRVDYSAGCIPNAGGDIEIVGHRPSVPVEVIHEDDRLFPIYYGWFDWDPKYLVDIPKSAFRNGQLDTTKANLLLIKNPDGVLTGVKCVLLGKDT